MEGSTGYDTEFVHAGEPVPAPLFGFVRPINNGQPVTGGAAGAHQRPRRCALYHYVPPKGGVFDIYNGFTGSKIRRPITDAWISLTDLQARRRGRLGRARPAPTAASTSPACPTATTC